MSGHFRVNGVALDADHSWRLVDRETLEEMGAASLASSTSRPFALVVGRGNLMYFMDFDEHYKDGSGGPDAVRTITLREVHYKQGELVPGPRVSRRLIEMSDLEFLIDDADAERFGLGDHMKGDSAVIGEKMTDEEWEAHFSAAISRATSDVIGDMTALVGVPGGPNKRSVTLDGGATPSRSVAEALDDDWPHDGWTGTAKEVHDLIGGESGPYTLDAVKRALARGRYESEETPGKPSVWRATTSAK